MGTKNSGMKMDPCGKQTFSKSKISKAKISENKSKMAVGKYINWINTQKLK